MEGSSGIHNELWIIKKLKYPPSMLHSSLKLIYYILFMLLAKYVDILPLAKSSPCLVVVGWNKSSKIIK
jgi:hypothetical protein